MIPLPIDWVDPATGEPAHTLTLREKLLQVRAEVERLQCATWRTSPQHDCPRCRALELLDDELNK